MQAVVKVTKGIGNIKVDDISDPTPKVGQVKLKIHAAGISESDLHMIDDRIPCTPPVILGREVAGEVVEVGQDVSDDLLGMRVTPEMFFQPDLSYTIYGSYHHDRQSLGRQGDGGFAEYIIVPATNLHRIPEHISYREGALTLPLAYVIQSVLLRTTSVRPGDLAVIAGSGTVALLTLQILIACHATTVVIGTHEDSHRLAVARDLGADYVMNMETRDIGALVQDVSIEGLGSDVVYECSGSDTAPQQLLTLLRPGGRYIQMARFTQSIHWDMNCISSKELTITGSTEPTSESWIRAIRLMKHGAVKTAPLLTHDFKLSQWEQAFNTVKQKLGIKVLFRPHYQKIGSITNRESRDPDHHRRSE